MNKGVGTQPILSSTTSLTTRTANGGWNFVASTECCKQNSEKELRHWFAVCYVWLYEILPCMRKSQCLLLEPLRSPFITLTERRQNSNSHCLIILTRFCSLMGWVDELTNVTCQAGVEIFIWLLQHLNNYCPSGGFHSLALFLLQRWEDSFGLTRRDSVTFAYSKWMKWFFKSKSVKFWGRFEIMQGVQN